MDAQAHLLSLGWAGPGHALDARPYKQKGHRGLAYDPNAAKTSAGNGLIKPLLVSQRQARLGIGKKAHEPQSGNEWWLKGFESALGNIGKSESERSSGASTPVLADYGAHKHSGLYSFFVKGQQIEGTIGQDVEILSKKRKSEALGDTALATNAEKSKKQKTAEDFKQVAEYISVRDKDEKRRKRVKRPSPEEEFEQVGEYLEVREGRIGKKQKVEAVLDDEDAPVPEEKRVETKEERRQRRRKRKEEKARSHSEAAQERSVEASDARASESEDAAKKAARKAERRRRKAEKAARLKTSS